MSLLNFLSRSKTSAAPKTSSKPVRIAAACMVLASVGIVAKTVYEFASVVTGIQHTISPASQMPSEAEGAFYFIEPETSSITL